MFAKNSLKALLASGALIVAAGAVNAATVTYESAEADPKVQLVIDDSIAGKFRFTLTTTFGDADFLGLGFDFAGAAITQAMISLVSYTPVVANTPVLELFGNNTNAQVDCGQGCNFQGNGTHFAPYDYIIRIGEQGAGDKLVSSVVFDIALAGSLANNPFADFGVRAQSTTGPTDSIKVGLVQVPEPVPVPAAGFLLIGALGGLAALRRRRRAV